ncbi:MAG: diaminopimelate epimerase [Thermodesulfobacteriota bacterium]|nr:diaminopimelate epimerase [Thermodesulfobacteriota bacterium]
MKNITFFKMSGSGNDFIIIDNRNNVIDETGLTSFIKKVCMRRMSAGADGLILIERHDSADFKWRYFNSDGGRAEMCGNGARCAARFAYLNGIAGSSMSFLTDAGIVQAQVTGDRSKVKMPDPSGIKDNCRIELKGGPVTVSSINTGVPHAVLITDDIDGVDVAGTGREIRFHEYFAPAGTNVNFITGIKNGTISIRTYERGVEDETLACGTGSIASALVTAFKNKAASPVNVITRSGGVLTIYFREDNGRFYDVYLEGDARVIYKGELWEDAWRY